MTKSPCIRKCAGKKHTDCCTPAAFPQFGGALRNAFPLWMLVGEKESLNQFPFAAHDHPGEPFVPFAFWDFSVPVEPIGQQFKLFRRNFPISDAFE